jgi:hypothetical protein
MPLRAPLQPPLHAYSTPSAQLLALPCAPPPDSFAPKKKKGNDEDEGKGVVHDDVWCFNIPAATFERVKKQGERRRLGGAVHMPSCPLAGPPVRAVGHAAAWKLCLGCCALRPSLPTASLSPLTPAQRRCLPVPSADAGMAPNPRTAFGLVTHRKRVVLFGGILDQEGKVRLPAWQAATPRPGPRSPTAGREGGGHDWGAPPRHAATQ